MLMVLTLCAPLKLNASRSRQSRLQALMSLHGMGSGYVMAAMVKECRWTILLPGGLGECGTVPGKRNVNCDTDSMIPRPQPTHAPHTHTHTHTHTVVAGSGDARPDVNDTTATGRLGLRRGTA